MFNPWVERKGYPPQYSGLENSWRSPWGRKESDMTERLSLSQNILELVLTEEGNNSLGIRDKGRKIF